jgi:hypothetical protein
VNPVPPWDEWLAEFGAAVPEVMEIRAAPRGGVWGIECDDGLMIAFEVDGQGRVEWSAELGAPAPGCERIAANLALRANGVPDCLGGSVLGMAGDVDEFCLFDRGPAPESALEFHDRLSGFIHRARRWRTALRELEPAYEPTEPLGVRV